MAAKPIGGMRVVIETPCNQDSDKSMYGRDAGWCNASFAVGCSEHWSAMGLFPKCAMYLVPAFKIRCAHVHRIGTQEAQLIVSPCVPRWRCTDGVKCCLSGTMPLLHTVPVSRYAEAVHLYKHVAPTRLSCAWYDVQL